MMDALENLQSSTKFILLILMYTGYLTWWASGVSSALENVSKNIATNTELINSHTTADYAVTLQTIRLVENFKKVEHSVDEHTLLLQKTMEQHTKCGVILDGLIKRLENIERR